MAQQAEPTVSDQQAEATAEDIGIADIVVTAQRREESAQRAAIAIDVVGPTALENAGVNSAQNLNAVVPSLYVTRAGGPNTSFFIRGVGNFTKRISSSIAPPNPLPGSRG